MAKSKKSEVEEVEPVPVEAPGAVHVLVLHANLVAIVHAHRSGRATNADISALWSALYEAAGPLPAPKPRIVGK